MFQFINLFIFRKGFTRGIFTCKYKNQMTLKKFIFLQSLTSSMFFEGKGNTHKS